MKTYSPPKLNKLTSDQATLFLIGQAGCGDQGAKDLLDVLYPEPEGNRNVCANFAENDRSSIKGGTSGLIRRALTALQSAREDFRRFVRG